MAAGTRDYQPGEQVPGTVYRVMRLLGAGGMGTVYDVEDTTIGKRYVLKTLLPQLGARDDLARRMQNEARTLARLNHPNIVEVITAGVTADDLRLPYYVMERLSGTSLRIVLEKKGPLPLMHAYHIAIDLLDALDHAHEAGVVHRDVKPDNVFLHRTQANTTITKLLDFGIVSILDSGSKETAGRFVGTLRYAAPEQLKGAKPTPKMDLYAAGLVLYEMITGRGPFDDVGDQLAIADAHMKRTPSPPSYYAPGLPREVDMLLMAALAKDPEGRPRDAFAFAASLRNFKKAQGGERAKDSTENRATAAQILDPASAASAPQVHVRQNAPQGPYVISPAPMPLPLVTEQGMTPPTVGPPIVHAASMPERTATRADEIDRGAATRSQAIEPPRPAGPHGTAALPIVTPSPPQATQMPPTPRMPSAPPMPGEASTLASAGVAPIQWPAERSMVLSDEPSVRTVPGLPRRSGGAIVAIALAVAGGLLAIVAVVVVARKHLGAQAAATAGSSAPVVIVSAQPVAAIPAPTIAPPSIDDTSAAAASASAKKAAAVAAAPPVATAGKPKALPAVAPTKSVAATTAAPPPAPAATPTALPDRPGPGF